jgi:hypothetical protein
MRPKYLFALRLVLFAVLLSILWPLVSAVYVKILSATVEGLRSTFGAGPIDITKEKYSYFLVPVFSLIAAASGVALKRKLIFGSLALAVRLALDAVNMASGLSDIGEGGVGFGDGILASSSTIVYQASLWALPLALILIFLQNDPERLWSPAQQNTLRCPICGANKIGLADHIQHVHGEKALKSKKVRAALGL